MCDLVRSIATNVLAHVVRRQLLQLASAFIAVGCILATTIVVQAQEQSSKRGKPNIVFILADDLGYTDLACYGSRYYETPALDRLAAQGMRLDAHHHCQNCQPTRAALMTGQYAPRTGIYTVGGVDRFDWSQRPLRPVDNVTELPLDRVTIAGALKQAGYATGMFGKWHLGEDDKYHPSQRGFDEAISTAGKHFNFVTRPKVEYPQGTYLADFLTDRACDFIRRHRDEPFFLYLPHFGVHSPHDAKESWIAKFRDKPGVGGHKDPTYAAMIASVDESVGRVVALLDELRLTDNTVVIFSSDNGGVGGYDREGLRKNGGITDNAPLRSGKGSLYEGGTRVPLIVRWPGVTKPGTRSDEPTIHVDVFPTLLDIAGGKPPTGQTLDGVSLVPALRDPQTTFDRAIFQHFPGYLGVGDGQWRTTPVGVIQRSNWKLLEFFEDGRLELYNLAKDIGEQKNLAEAQPDKLKKLHDEMLAWRTSVGAKLPGKNEPSAKANSGKSKKKKKKE